MALKEYDLLELGVGYVYLCKLYQSNRWAEEVPCPTNKGVSYTNLVFGLVMTLKYIIIISIIMILNIVDVSFMHIIIMALTRYQQTLFSVVVCEGG